MNLPNKLTIFRIILVPVLVIIALLDVPNKWIFVNLVFIIASITDKLDGDIARKTNQVTTFGKFLDPLADKILVLSAMMILVEIGEIPAWIPIIVITREFVVSGYRLIAVEQNGEVIAASIWGKIKTVTQMIAIILAFISVHMGNNLIHIITMIIMIISVIATVFSGVNYLKGCKELLWTKDMQKKE